MEVFTKFFRVAWGARMTQECFLTNLVYHFLIQHKNIISTSLKTEREMKPILLRFSLVFGTVSCSNFKRRERTNTFLKEKRKTV